MMQRLAFICAALMAATALTPQAQAEGAAIAVRSGQVSPPLAVPLRAAKPGGIVLRRDGDKAQRHRGHGKWRDKRRKRRVVYVPYGSWFDRRREEPRTEVVIVERPAAPEPAAPPPPPPRRIDLCRNDPVQPEQEGSGRVLFVEPPIDGCPRFARAPSQDGLRLPQIGDDAAQ